MERFQYVAPSGVLVESVAPAPSGEENQYEYVKWALWHRRELLAESKFVDAVFYVFQFVAWISVPR